MMLQFALFISYLLIPGQQWTGGPFESRVYKVKRTSGAYRSPLIGVYALPKLIFFIIKIVMLKVNIQNITFEQKMFRLFIMMFPDPAMACIMCDMMHEEIM